MTAGVLGGGRGRAPLRRRDPLLTSGSLRPGTPVFRRSPSPHTNRGVADRGEGDEFFRHHRCSPPVLPLVAAPPSCSASLPPPLRRWEANAIAFTLLETVRCGGDEKYWPLPSEFALPYWS
jgi:hypothetical protein